jgi:Collagen triple helix repeat (20 copies)
MKTLDRTKAISIAMTSVLSISISLSTLATPSYASTPSKKFHMAGRVTNSSTNTLRNGKGAPTSALGIDGDFYIDTLKFNLYGPKANGRWPTPVSLRGPAGVNGANGKAGTNGVSGKNGASGGKGSTTSVAGPKGVQGLTGAQGPIGLTGPQGVQGATGAAGPSGIKGDTGATGAAGTTGATGPAGPMGAPGSMGASGSPGSMGPQGATGPSQMSIGAIIFPQQLKAGAGASVTSNPFGSFAAGKDYFVHLQIYGVRAVTDFASLRISIYALGGSPTIQMSYLISDGRSYRTAIGENDTNLDVIATIDGSLVPTAFQLGATISALDNTSTDFVTFAGTYVDQLVGSLT